jgi:hypothetical protein
MCSPSRSSVDAKPRRAAESWLPGVTMTVASALSRPSASPSRRTLGLALAHEIDEVVEERGVVRVQVLAVEGAPEVPVARVEDAHAGPSSGRRRCPSRYPRAPTRPGRPAPSASA